MPAFNPTFTDNELEPEEWRKVVGWECVYEVSNLGRVRRLKSAKGARPGRVLAQSLDDEGYLKAHLCDGPRDRGRRTHILVLEAFVGPRPQGMEGNHKDGKKENARGGNLEWITPLANQQHAASKGLKASGDRSGARKHPESVRRGERRPGAKLTEAQVKAIRSSPQSSATLSRHLGVSFTTVSKIRRGLKWKHVAEDD